MTNVKAQAEEEKRRFAQDLREAEAECERVQREAEKVDERHQRQFTNVEMERRQLKEGMDQIDFLLCARAPAATRWSDAP